MMDILKPWLELHVDKHAVTALEYALIAAVIASVMVVGATTLGNGLSAKFTALAGSLT